MHSRRLLSFLLTKKNPAPAGDEDGLMRPATRGLLYFSMDLVSGADSENSLPLGGVVPGSRSMAQSYGRCGGNDLARVSLNTPFRSRYSLGTPEISVKSEGTTRLGANDETI